MALRVSDFIEVTATVSGGAPAVTFGRTLFLSPDTTLPAGGAGKVGVFSNLSSLGEEFDSTSEPYRAGLRYFAQDPFPKPFLVGRWANALANTQIVGGAPAAVADISGTAVSDGSLRLESTDITGISFAQNATYANIATSLQTAINAAQTTWSAATVAYTNSRFEVTFAPDVAITGVFSEHSAGTGTDLSELMALTSATGAALRLGSAVETISEGLDAMRSANSGFDLLVLDRSLNDDAEASQASNWCQANSVIFMGEVNDVAALVAGDTTSRAATISATQPDNVGLTFSDAPVEYQAAQASAILSAVDLDRSGSLITLKFKTLGNATPVNLSEAQKQELDRKRINSYSNYDGTAMYAEGYSLGDNGWLDERLWINWLKKTLSSRLFAHLRSTPRVPLTAPGISALKQVITSVLQLGIQNGGIAPGRISAALTADIRQAVGDQSFDGNLSNGYLVYFSPLADQSQADRDARKAPPVSIWVKGSGAAHSLKVNVRFEQ